MEYHKILCQIENNPSLIIEKVKNQNEPIIKKETQIDQENIDLNLSAISENNTKIDFDLSSMSENNTKIDLNLSSIPENSPNVKSDLSAAYNINTTYDIQPQNYLKKSMNHLVVDKKNKIIIGFSAPSDINTKKLLNAIGEKNSKIGSDATPFFNSNTKIDIQPQKSMSAMSEKVTKIDFQPQNNHQNLLKKNENMQANRYNLCFFLLVIFGFE